MKTKGKGEWGEFRVFILFFREAIHNHLLWVRSALAPTGFLRQCLRRKYGPVYGSLPFKNESERTGLQTAEKKVTQKKAPYRTVISTNAENLVPLKLFIYSAL